jgi:hypothetical protein
MSDELYEMLPQRTANTEELGLIYHYCSPDTLIAILSSRSLRYSDLNMMNDAHEGLWGYHLFERAADKLIKRDSIPAEWPDFSVEFADRIDELWSDYGLKLANFVACFSKDGDSLSQWRAYADDATGFAIGFDAKLLRSAQPVQMLDVLYDPQDQLDEMARALAAIKLEYDDRKAEEDFSWFGARCGTLAASSIAFKNPAWRDEKEIRCHHLIGIERSEDHMKLVDNGGSTDGGKVEGRSINYNMRRGAITASVDIPFPNEPSKCPLKEIVLGPKCNSGAGNVALALGNFGFRNVAIKSTGTAYR